MDSGKRGREARERDAAERHWQGSLRVIGVLLSAWFLVSFGAGILFRSELDAALPAIGAAPFGFWMGQQGSIISFVVILIIYRFWMKRLDDRFAAEVGLAKEGGAE